MNSSEERDGPTSIHNSHVRIRLGFNGNYDYHLCME